MSADAISAPSRAAASPLVSVVAPAFNENDSLRPLTAAIREVLEGDGRRFEILFVDNGSSDDSLATLKALHAEDPRVNFLSLSRNFGHQGGLIAGLENCRGDVVITMDADLQHPPELIPELLRQWAAGSDIVFTLKRADPTQSMARRLANGLFYGFLSRISGLQLSGGQSDFRLLDRAAADALIGLPERNKFLRGLTSWIGFRQTSLSYEVRKRRHGRSKFRMVNLTRFALDGILSFSILPLRLFTLTGMVISALSLAYVGWILLDWAYSFVFHGKAPPLGWPSMASGIFFLGGVQLIGIGLLGEYLGRIFDEVRHRPAYLVRESSVAAPERRRS